MKQKPAPSLQDPVRYLPGVGPKKALLFEELGVRTAGDLLDHFPFRIEDFSRVVPIDQVHPGDEVTVQGAVVSTTFVGSQRGRAFRAALTDGRGMLHLVWYNMPYMHRNFRPGQVVLASGKAEWRRSGLEMAHPNWRESAGPATRGPIIPVYHSTQGLTSQAIHKVVKAAALTYGGLAHSGVPAEILRKHGCASDGQAYRDIHDPSSASDWHAARRTFAFREMLYLQLALLAMRQEAQATPGPGDLKDLSLADRFLADLPFRPTSAQMRAIADVRGDLSSGKAMNRLLQGDVGSGKTVVAMYALLACVGSGFQGAFLAPTEILAEQHLRTFDNLCKDLPGVAFLSGSTGAAERRKVLEGLAAGDVRVIIGTHALLGPEVKWSRLGVVITDEQHRFGVKQRLTLSGNTGVVPHVLVMSATPIPRSLALTLYGDLDISVIDVMPPGRTPAKTAVLDSRARQTAYRRVREEVAAGRQAYVVCPLIREGQTGRKAAEMVRDELEHGALRGLRLGLIHGDLPRKEVDATMQAFLRNEVQVVVSTTVIEVGIDAPNASVMVVEDADTFGLATLHQLRGRVGRGKDASFCFLIASGGTDSGRERLKVMETLSDGFSVAEADLAQRGPGQFFGTEQSGLPEVKLTDLQLSLDVVTAAREEARELLKKVGAGEQDTPAARLFAEVQARFGDLFVYGRSR